MELYIDDYKINYKISGEGKTVIILQGWGTELSLYNPIAQILSPKYRVIQLDLPGFGKSDEPREAWDVEKYVEFFLKFVETFKLNEVFLIGHSFGGRMIIRLASRDKLPFAIRKLVLIDSAGILPKKSFKQKFKIKIYKFISRCAKLKIVQLTCPELINNWRNKQGSEDYRNASPMMKQCLVKTVNEDLTDRLRSIQAETLLIWGENDTATPISDAHKMEQMIPHAGLVVLKGAGHYSFLEQPYIFDRVIKSFFEIEVKQ